MTVADLDAALLAESVRRALAARPADEETAWQVAVELGLPLLCSGPEAGSFEDALTVLMELGRRASSAPVLESVIVNRAAPGLVPAGSRIALGVGALGGDALAGTVAFAEGTASGALRLVEGAARADYLVIVDPSGRIGAVERTDPGLSVEETPALSAGLCDVRFQSARLQSTRPLANGAKDLLTLLRLGLCARALGAAVQGFELIVDYAKVRRQFGQAIGAFQAVQHKLADSQIRLDACRLQLLGAARACDRASPSRLARAASAIAYSSAALRQVALETQHGFGAIGYAEEHAAPALFRRVHADVARLGGAAWARHALGEHLIAAGDGAMQALCADEDDPAAGFRARLRDWLDENWTAAHRAALRSRPFEERDWDLDLLARLGRDGWTTLNWPATAGGMAASPLEQLAFIEEMYRADAPAHALVCPCRIIAPEIIAHGSPVLKEQLLPRIRAGSVTGCLGYSEPEAGSDLASLRTSARREGDHYVISGQKIWTTDGHRASHMILAARTGSESRARQAGISLFILPMDSPGISVRTMTGLHGHVFCSIFFDDVRLPADWRLGEEGQGWSILANALANERIGMGGFVSRLAVLFDRLLGVLRDRPGLAGDSATTARIGELAAQLVTGRELALASVAPMEGGAPPLVAAAAAKIYASELAQTLCEAALDMVGGTALLGQDAPDAPADGLIEEILRLSIMYVVGGGSNEIQRSLIAIRGLGLGR
ncbi:acyl-CoA dehydrogenase family protein [Sphingobium estronivorans]|uniref:acyl-CoA dehydrogenase family protein n=1 Tax=Sphingobium estronivorans TaxID=1577690 RepID=UPI0013C340FF|nr:acyl-CoA dehydrogenase family protein [Sphingobium estronivorans]